jgi:hypothetical protein
MAEWGGIEEWVELVSQRVRRAVFVRDILIHLFQSNNSASTNTKCEFVAGTTMRDLIAGTTRVNDRLKPVRIGYERTQIYLK